jgi:hypothetical protein
MFNFLVRVKMSKFKKKKRIDKSFGNNIFTVFVELKKFCIVDIIICGNLHNNICNIQ